VIDSIRRARSYRRRLPIGVVLVAVLVSSSFSSRTPGVESHGQQRGFALPTWSRDGYADPKMDNYLHEIITVGAGWIQFTPTGYQGSVDANEITSTSQTVTDAGVERAISIAHEHGLKVLLKPLVDLSDSPGSQARISPGDRDAWFASYTSFISHYADIAARLTVEEFAVGTELAGVSEDRDHWLDVIRSVRARYQGTLVYAANFNEYVDVSFWDSLDLIGIDAYWSLSQRPTSDAAVLERAWQPIRADLAAFAAANHRRILFTEAGYTSERGTTTLPYSWTISQTPDQAEQAAAYQALLASFDKQPWWAGVFWWVWDVLPNEGGNHTLDFSPGGKLADNVVRRWWAY
jgi:glycosyl hydrolase family 113